MEWYIITLMLFVYMWTIQFLAKTCVEISKIICLGNTRERVDFAHEMHQLKSRLAAYTGQREDAVNYPPTYQ